MAGRATREIDPRKENVLTTVSFGLYLYRDLTLPGVPVAGVDNLDNYGLLPGVSEQRQRTRDGDFVAQIGGPSTKRAAL